MTTTATMVIWSLVFFAPSYQTRAAKLVVHTFETQAACQDNIPAIKRYYKIYGNKWRAKCTKTVEHNINP